MKYPLAIFTAAAATLAALLQSMSGESQIIDVDPDAPTPIPQPTQKLVESLAYSGGSDAEIADRFLMDESIFREQYRDVLCVARALRRLTLRKLQFELARKLNGPVLTWLGRNELGQSLNPTTPGEAEPEFPADAF